MFADIKLRFVKFGTELLQVGIGQALAALGGLVGVRLLTQFMTPSSYGELALGMTFMVLSQQLVMGPISGSFARYFPIAQEMDSLNTYIQAVWRLLARASGLIAILFVIILSGLFLSGNQNWIPLLILIFLFTLVSSFNIVLDNIQNAARHRVIVAWHQGVSQWLRFLLAVGMILLFGSSSIYALLGYFLSAVLVIFSQGYFFRKKLLESEYFGNRNSNQPRDTWENQMIRFALPFSAWGLFGWAQLSSDRWALQVFHSTADVGLYSVLYQLGFYPITILTGIFVQFITPILYRRAGNGMVMERIRSVQETTYRIVLASLGFAGLSALAAWIFRDVVFILLVSPSYRGVSYLLPWMVLSGGLFAAGQICALIPLNNNQPEKLLVPKIATSLLGILFNLIGAYWFGLQGVVIAGLCFSTIYFLWILGLFRPKIINSKRE